MTTTRPEPETDEANEAAVQAARDAYRPAYEQGLDSGIASCADWFGWHAAIKAAKPEIQRQALRDLQDRLDNADEALTNLERATPGGAFKRKVRLAGKIEGVRLALSYIQEALRMAPPAEEARP